MATSTPHTTRCRELAMATVQEELALQDVDYDVNADRTDLYIPAWGMTVTAVVDMWLDEGIATCRCDDYGDPSVKCEVCGTDAILCAGHELPKPERPLAARYYGGHGWMLTTTLLTVALVATVAASAGPRVRPCYRHHVWHPACTDCTDWHRAHPPTHRAV